jgi:hypothetical protein
MRAKESPTPLPDTPTTKFLPPETQRVSSSGNQRVSVPGNQRVSLPGNQRVSLLGKQRVSEESRTDLHYILNASDLQTNNGHISIWEQARESEFSKILMSNLSATATKTHHTPIPTKAYICK